MEVEQISQQEMTIKECLKFVDQNVVNGCYEANDRTRNVNVGKWKRNVRLSQGEKIVYNKDKKENQRVSGSKRGMQLGKDKEVNSDEMVHRKRTRKQLDENAKNNEQMEVASLEWPKINQ